jgi:hypothetical protein
MAGFEYCGESHHEELCRRPEDFSSLRTGSIPTLSKVVPLPLSDVGAVLVEGKTMSGGELTERGLEMRLAKSPRVVWVVYQRVQ